MPAGFARTCAFVVTVGQRHILVEDVKLYYYDFAVFVCLPPLGAGLIVHYYTTIRSTLSATVAGS